MRTAALEYLACPACGGQLVADAERPAADGHVMAGVLGCACGVRYPIERGVPRLLPEHAGRSERGASARGAGRWVWFPRRSRRHEALLFEAIWPLAPADFAGALVLDAGCGDGRNAATIAGYGADAVVAVDRGPGVDVAFRYSRHLPDMHVVEGALEQLPVQRAFDAAIAVGGIHRTGAPAEAVGSVLGKLVPGGRLAISVPAREQNSWLARVLEPLRSLVTTRVDERSLYWLTMGPSIAIAAAARGCRVTSLARALPYGEHLRAISDFPVREIHRVLFGELADRSSFVTEADLRSWLAAAGAGDVVVESHSGYAWRATARARRNATAASA